MASPDFKVGAKILVTGCNGSGKSSLINKLTGNEKLAKVGDTVSPTQHEAVAMKLEHDLKVGDGSGTTPVVLIDTQGFGDSSTSDEDIADSIAEQVESADVVLICHRLYRRIDGPIVQELRELVNILGKELMKHTVFVFTCGDEYLTNCGTFPATKLSNEEIKKQMKFQAEEIKQKMIEILTSNGIKEEIAVNIPHCITSSRSDDLPTGQWVDSLWEKCESKCRPEAKQFVSWIRRHPYKVALGATVAVAAGVITTAVIFCAANSSSQSQATHASGPPAIPSTPFHFSGYKPIIDLPLHNNIFGGRSNNRRLKAIGVGALGSGAAGVAMGITSPLVTKDFIIRRRY